MRLSRIWIVGAAWLVGQVGRMPAAQACGGTTDHIVGYSWQRDEYVTEERSLDGAAPSRFVTRALGTDQVVDYATCSGPAPCTAPDTLGMQACWLHPLPNSPPLELSLGQVEGDPAGAEVRLAENGAVVSLVRLHRAGRLILRSAVRSESSVILFLADTVEEKGCARTHERAVAVSLAPPGGDVPEIDLTLPAVPVINLREAPPLSPERLEPLAMAARSAAAAHLDALAACWAQQALSIMAAARARRSSPDPTIEVEDVRVILSPP